MLASRASRNKIKTKKRTKNILHLIWLKNQILPLLGKKNPRLREFTNSPISTYINQLMVKKKSSKSELKNPPKGELKNPP